MKLGATIVRLRLWLGALALFLLLSGMRLYWLGEKAGLHLDESMSVTLANRRSHGWEEHLPDGRIFYAAELRGLVWQGDTSWRSTWRDLYALHIQVKNDPHSNLYYSLLRLALLDSGRITLATIIWRGGLLNLVFFAFSFWLMFLLLRALFPRYPALWLPALLIVFGHSDAVSNTLFIRPYPMQEALFVLLALVFVRSWRLDPSAGPGVFSWLRFLGVAAVLALVLLSGYFAVFFVMLLGALLLVRGCVQRHAGWCRFWIAVFLQGVMLAVALYLSYFEGFFNYRGLQALDKIMLRDPVVYHELPLLFWGVLQRALFPWTLLVLLALAWGWSRWRQPWRWRRVASAAAEQPWVLLWLSALLWSAAIFFVAPYKLTRYLAPALPLLALLYPAVAVRVAGVNRGAGLGLAWLCALWLCTGMLPPGRHLDYLEREARREVATFAERPALPVVFLLPRPMHIHQILPYLDERQPYIFCSRFSALRPALPPGGEFYLVLFHLTEAERESMRQYRLPPGYECLDRRDGDSAIYLRCRRSGGW